MTSAPWFDDGVATRESASDAGTDVAQHRVDLTAEERKSDDKDDSDECEDECIFGETLSPIVRTAGRGQ